MMQKFIPFLMALVLAIPSLPARDFEYEGIWYTVTSEEDMTCITRAGNLNFPGNKVSGEITIPPIVTDGDNNYFVEGIGEFSFGDSCNDLAVMHIESYVKYKIGQYAFQGSKLEKIDLPKSLTEIGVFAFSRCNLTNIKIPSGVSYISYGVFERCLKLTTVHFDDGVNEISTGAFAECENLCSVNFPSTLSYIHAMAFKGCHSLTSIFLQSPVFLGSDAFAYCTNLRSITLPSLMGGCFLFRRYFFPE